MKSLWNDKDAQAWGDELGLRVYTSRLLGQDKSLVLHGGGNTSVKIREKDILGQEQSLLYVKGSGWDLESIDRAGFAPVHLDHLLALARLQTLSDPQMVNELKTHTTIATAPTPSVEAILHALLPYKYVDHTHADAVIAVTNTPGGLGHIKAIYGDDVVIVPYVMPGFDLARDCARLFGAQRTDNTIGMVLMNHGIFSFADTARESYERMIELVSRAEDYLKRHKAWDIPESKCRRSSEDRRTSVATLRARICDNAGFPMLMSTDDSDASLGFIQRKDVTALSQQGPATPDHVIRTKRIPMLGSDVQAYSQTYVDYFNEHAAQAKEEKTMLDTAPRVVLDDRLGLCALGRSAKDVLVVREIYQHTMAIIQRAELLESYRALPAADVFSVEYWDLEQAKLRAGGKPPVFSGEVAWVTGAASGIGRACVESFLKRGAAVVALDIDPKVCTEFNRSDYLGVVCDVSKADQLVAALEQGVKAYGGMDMLVLNAGVFPAAMNIADMDMAVWQKTLSINLDANMQLLKLAKPLLSLSPRKGRVVVIGSKNVPAPGPGAAAYSASKAALNQLLRVAALEWGAEGIRLNTVHPNAVFDTGLWTEEVLQSRANSYGLSVDDYKKRNVMKTEVCSADVAEMVAEMCGPLFARTTAAQVPIDGGDMRVI